jgi:hypothetical protein
MGPGGTHSTQEPTTEFGIERVNRLTPHSILRNSDDFASIGLASDSHPSYVDVTTVKTIKNNTIGTLDLLDAHSLRHVTTDDESIGRENHIDQMLSNQINGHRKHAEITLGDTIITDIAAGRSYAQHMYGLNDETHSRDTYQMENAEIGLTGNNNTTSRTAQLWHELGGEFTPSEAKSMLENSRQLPEAGGNRISPIIDDPVPFGAQPDAPLQVRERTGNMDGGLIMERPSILARQPFTRPLRPTNDSVREENLRNQQVDGLDAAIQRGRDAANRNANPDIGFDPEQGFNEPYFDPSEAFGNIQNEFSDFLGSDRGSDRAILGDRYKPITMIDTEPVVVQPTPDPDIVQRGEQGDGLTGQEEYIGDNDGREVRILTENEQLRDRLTESARSNEGGLTSLELERYRNASAAGRARIQQRIGSDNVEPLQEYMDAVEESHLGSSKSFGEAFKETLSPEGQLRGIASIMAADKLLGVMDPDDMLSSTWAKTTPRSLALGTMSGAIDGLTAVGYAGGSALATGGGVAGAAGAVSLGMFALPLAAGAAGFLTQDLSKRGLDYLSDRAGIHGAAKEAIGGIGSMALGGCAAGAIIGGALGCGAGALGGALLGGASFVYDHYAPGWVKDRVGAIGDNISGFHPMAAISGIADLEGEVINRATAAVVDVAEDAAEAVGEGILDAGEAVGEGLLDAGEAVGGGIVDAAEAVGEGVEDAVDAIGDAASSVGNAISSFFHW